MRQQGGGKNVDFYLLEETNWWVCDGCEQKVRPWLVDRDILLDDFYVADWQSQ